METVLFSFLKNAVTLSLPIVCGIASTFHHFCIAFFSSRQRDLYEETFRDLVDNVLQGFNGTIFAYGQTGTGKTFTMQGKNGKHSVNSW